MNNSAAQGMSNWHNGGGGNGNYFNAPPGPYQGYPGGFQVPPGPPPPGPPPQQGWGGYGAAGYGGYPGYASWGYTVPPGMPVPPMQSTADNTNTNTTDSNKKSNDNSNSNSNISNDHKNNSTNSTDNSNAGNNNPPLPPGPPPPIGPPPPPPGETNERGKQGDMTTNPVTSTSSTPPTTPSKNQGNVETQNPSLQQQQQGYNSQDYTQQAYNMYHQGYNQSYDGFSGYGGGWYGPLGPPPPNFSKPPPGVPPPGVPPPGVPPPSGPVKFNLPNKKGLGYNAFQHTMTQQQQQNQSPTPQHQQQQYHQQQQQQRKQNQQQQHHQQQQQHPQQQQQHFQPNNNKKNKKDKKNNNMNNALINNLPWKPYMNQQQQQHQQHQQQQQQREEAQHAQQMQQQKQQQQQQQEANMMMAGKGKIGNNNNDQRVSEMRDEKRMVKDAKNMSGLVATGDWPESLKVYVGRAFSRCQTELDKDQVEICLKGKLTQAANNGTLWTKNWEEEPLPSIHSEAAANFLSQMSSLKSWTPTTNSPSQASSSDTNSASPTKTPASPNSRNKSPRFKKQSMTLGYMKGGRSLRSRSHSDSRSKSRSKSRSRSPVGRRRGGGMGGDGSRRRHSSESEDESRGFIKLKSKRERSPISARGKMNKKMKNKFKADCHFYSEHGVMKLDPEFSTNERLQKRAARFNPTPARTPGPRTPNAGQNNFQRKKKFGIKKTINVMKPITASFTVDNEDIDWSNLHVVGTSTTLEKQYLRLTTAPDPSTVRTVPTLMKALDHIRRQWVREQDYRYACDQLKSLRQDLTIQGIRDNFTVQVYETHSRIALEKGDHEEFNQCQSQLKQLYAEVGGDNRLEFLAYRLLYYIFTKNTLDITSLMAGLTEAEKCDECVGFALRLRAAWSLGNYHRLFRLYRSAPKMAGYLVDWFAERERKQAMRAILKGYRPGSLDVSFIRAELALTADEDWEKFEGSMNLVYIDATKTKLDCKKSVVDVPAT